MTGPMSEPFSDNEHGTEYSHSVQIYTYNSCFKIQMYVYFVSLKWHVPAEIEMHTHSHEIIHIHTCCLHARSLTPVRTKKKAECGADKVFIFRRQYDARYYVRIVSGVESASPDIVCIGPRKAEILKTKRTKKQPNTECVSLRVGFFWLAHARNKNAKQQTQAKPKCTHVRAIFGSFSFFFFFF